MVYVVKKTIKGRKYYYLYRSRWVNGKSKSEFVEYLGRDIPHNIENIKKKHELK